MSSSHRVFVGSRTRPPLPGITLFDLEVDQRSPRLVTRAELTDVEHPTYLVPHPSCGVVYAVSEIETGEIVSVGVDEDGMRVLQRVPSGGDSPCHVGTDGRHLVVANYGSGSAAGYTLGDDGRIADLEWSVHHRGGGPHWRQDGPHAHCAVIDPHRTSIHVVDLGTDRVVRYASDGGGFRRTAELVVTPGAGPRHLVFHPHDSIAFVVCELDNTVLVFDPDTDDPVVGATLPTLPAETTVDSLAAAVVVHPSGDHLYVSNRGHDSIAVFAHHHGVLTPVGHVASGGAGPRDIDVDPSGSLLLVANQRSGDITGFDLTDPGLPRPLGVLAEVDQPTCVVITGAAA